MVAKVKLTGEIIEVYKIKDFRYMDANKRIYNDVDLEFDFKDREYEKVAWIARDADGYIYLFQDEPEWDNYNEVFDDGSEGVWLGWKETMPEIKEGEKKQVKMTLNFCV